MRIFIVQRAQGSTPLVDVAAGLAALSLDELSAELGTIVIAPARAIRVGCVDPAAANYDSLATDSELRACQYVLGDEDSTQSADVDDGDAPVVVQTRASTASPSDGGPLAPGAALAELFANDPGAMAALVLAILVATLCGCALCARCAHRRAIASVSQRTKDAILKAESEAAAATAAALAAAAEAAAATAAAGASAAACDEAVSGEARARNELATLAQAQQQAALCATVGTRTWLGADDKLTAARAAAACSAPRSGCARLSSARRCADCGRHEGAARPVPDRPVPDPGAARRRVKLPALSAYGGTLPACVIYSSPGTLLTPRSWAFGAPPSLCTPSAARDVASMPNALSPLAQPRSRIGSVPRPSYGALPRHPPNAAGASHTPRQHGCVGSAAHLRSPPAAAARAHFCAARVQPVSRGTAPRPDVGARPQPPRLLPDAVGASAGFCGAPYETPPCAGAHTADGAQSTCARPRTAPLYAGARASEQARLAQQAAPSLRAPPTSLAPVGQCSAQTRDSSSCGPGAGARVGCDDGNARSKAGGERARADAATEGSTSRPYAQFARTGLFAD